MNADRIAAIRALLDAATPGAWEVEDGYTESGWQRTISASVPLAEMLYGTKDDAALIAAAPTIIAELLAEVERYQSYDANAAWEAE